MSEEQKVSCGVEVHASCAGTCMVALSTGPELGESWSQGLGGKLEG